MEERVLRAGLMATMIVDEERSNAMSRTLTLELPEQVGRALDQEAARVDKSPEQIALEWIKSRIEPPPRSSAEALMLSYGTWSMTPEEQSRVLRMIEEERLLEEDRP